MTKSEYVVWGVVAAALVGVLALAASTRGTPAAKPPVQATRTPPAPESAGTAPERTSGLLPAPAGELGDHKVVERSGRETNTSELRGKFVVLDFVFTNCGGPCPVMTAAMGKLQAALGKPADVRLVTFSVDPERDTPKALSDYADRYNADKDLWLFFRTDMDVIREIAYDRMRMVATREEPVVHSNKFALLDPTGRVRGLYSPMTDEKWLAKITADLETLRHEPAK
jgi:protein SCO1/2